LTDYSQSGEQAIILKALEGVQHGKFLDIGAWHPKTFSNVRALYELGWHGVMVEPSPGPMRDLLKEYGREPRITLIQAACGMNQNLQRLIVTDDALSTTDAGLAKAWGERGGYFGNVLVPTIPLEAILTALGPFDFVNIDTEGSSRALLEELLRLQEPRCICVEHDGQEQQLRRLAKTHGYQNYGVAVNLILWR